MRRRNRKHRKPIQQETHSRTIVLKGGHQENMLHDKGLIRPYFTATVSEPIPSCQINLIIENKSRKNRKKYNEKRRKHKNKKTPMPDWYENNLFMSFPSSKKSSIAFFIPLKDCICDFNDNDDFKNFMDWNSLLFYESNSSSMISNYNSTRKNSLCDKSMVSEFRKGRSSSESSINSEDSFICFEFSDDYTDENDNAHFSEEIQNENYLHPTPDIPSDTNVKGEKRKRVRFADNSELVEVHVIVAWDFAYRAARVGPWEVVARDAKRFKSKVQALEPIVSPILNPEHRSKIWQTRMEKFYN